MSERGPLADMDDSEVLAYVRTYRGHMMSDSDVEVRRVLLAALNHVLVRRYAPSVLLDALDLIGMEVT